MTALQWTTVINGTQRAAEGRYPGWTYDLVKDGPHNWSAIFTDEKGQRTWLATGVGFARARTAATVHHDRDQAWI